MCIFHWYLILESAHSFRPSRARFCTVARGNVIAPEEHQTRVDGFGVRVFKVNGSIVVDRAVLLLPTTAFVWNVSSIEDITVESLAPAYACIPRIGASHGSQFLCCKISQCMRCARYVSILYVNCLVDP